MSCGLQSAVLALLLGTAGWAVAQGTDGITLPTRELKTDSLAEPGPKGHRQSAGPAVPAEPTVLASALLGQTLYTTDGKRIGEISDLVMTRDLDGLLAVVGVGGFWGIGTRDVAIPKNSITVLEDGSGSPKLVASTTREQILQAPVFDRTALMR